jgi:hypothetical protein
MDELALKVKEEWIVTFNLPDPNFEAESVAGNILKSKGCTVFRHHDHYDINDDCQKRTVIGYVVE